jgi:hypothetical protein
LLQHKSNYVHKTLASSVSGALPQTPSRMPNVSCLSSRPCVKLFTAGVTPGDQLARNKCVTLQRAQEVHSHWITQTLYVKKDHCPTQFLLGCLVCGIEQTESSTGIDTPCFV